MPKLTIVAHVHANPDRVELVKSELERLIPATRAEKGCIQYDLHQDNEKPTHFMFYENWESREAWRLHMLTPHVAAVIEATKGAVAEATVYEMSQFGG